MVLRQLRQLQIPEERRQRSVTVAEDHGQIFAPEVVDRFRVARVLHQYQKSSSFRLLHAGRTFGADRSLLDRQGQPSGSITSFHLPGSQAGVGSLQRVRPDHEELHPDGIGHKAGLARQNRPDVLRPL